MYPERSREQRDRERYISCWGSTHNEKSWERLLTVLGYTSRRSPRLSLPTKFQGTEKKNWSYELSLLSLSLLLTIVSWVRRLGGRAGFRCLQFVSVRGSLARRAAHAPRQRHHPSPLTPPPTPSRSCSRPVYAAWNSTRVDSSPSIRPPASRYRLIASLLCYRFRGMG